MDAGASVKLGGFGGWGVADPRESRARKAVCMALLDLGEPELARRCFDWDMTTAGLPPTTADLREMQRRFMPEGERWTAEHP